MACVCLSACLSVSAITQQVLKRFSQRFGGLWTWEEIFKFGG